MKRFPIGGSIDAELKCDCENHSDRILEIKALYRLRDSSIQENGKILEYLDENMNWRKNHAYFYQLQTYLAIYGYQKGIFVVYTPKDILTLEINFDQNFWKNLKDNLMDYYENYYLNDFF